MDNNLHVFRKGDDHSLCLLPREQTNPGGENLCPQCDVAASILVESKPTTYYTKGK